MKYEVSAADLKKAKWPHEVFLINLIVNHVLLFVSLLGLASSYPLLLLVVPAISVVVLAYTLLGARRAHTTESWYVFCHWQIAAQRSRFFMLMLAIMAAVILLVLLVSGGEPKPQHYALGGVGILPTMLTVLALIVMESDAVHHAGNGSLPKWITERHPNPNAVAVEE